MKYKKYQFDSFRIFAVESDAFKSCHMEILFLDEARNVFMPKRYLLNQLMSYTTKKYQKKREVLIALENLYDASFYSAAYRMGETFVSSFSFDYLNPSYVNDKNYLESCVKFVCDSLFNPDITNNEFNERSMMIKKSFMHSSIDRYRENALEFALHESRKYLFQDSITSIDICGTHEEIDSITASDLALEYDKMMKDSSVDILVIGNLDMDKVAHLFEKYFKKKSIVEKEYAYEVCNKIGGYEELEVNSRYAQTQALMYLQYDKLTRKERFATSRVYNQILGNANQTDKLSMYLRINNPLSYYCGSKFNYSERFLTIYTGIKYENVQIAKEAMLKAIDEMNEGLIDEDYLELQKDKMLSNIRMQEDNMYYILNNYYLHNIMGEYLLDDLKDEIKRVTIEDIKEFSKKLSLSLVYILKETENEGN